MDYRVTCRACLTQNPRAPMFDLDDGDLRAIFAECAKLRTRKNDKYPQQLCCTCRSKVLKWNSFKDMVHDTDRKLGEIVPKEEEDAKDDEEADDDTMELDDTTLEENSLKLEEEDEQAPDDPREEDPGPKDKKTSADIKEEPTKAVGQRPKKKYKKRVFPVRAPRAKRNTPSLFKYPGAAKSLKWMKAEVQDAVEEEDEDDFATDDEEEDQAQEQEKEEVPAKKPKLQSLVQVIPHLQKAPLQCPLCNGVFSSVENFKKHFDEEHEDDVSPLQIKSESKEKTCPTCYMKIEFSDTLYKHTMRAHMGNPIGQAKQSESQTKMRPTTTSNKARVKRVALFKCGFCPREFQKQATFINHEREHYGDLVNSCTFCGAKFDTFELMKDHVANVHGENVQGRCKFCDKMIANVEKDVHSCVVERLYKCPVPQCDRRFSVKSNANRHVRLVHKDFKMPYKRPHKVVQMTPVIKKEPESMPTGTPSKALPTGTATPSKTLPTGTGTPTKALTPAIPQKNPISTMKQYFNPKVGQLRATIPVPQRVTAHFIPKTTANFVPKMFATASLAPKLSHSVVPKVSAVTPVLHKLSAATPPVVPIVSLSAAALTNTGDPKLKPIAIVQKSPEGSFQRDFEKTLKPPENVRVPVYSKGVFLGTYNKLVPRP